MNKPKIKQLEEFWRQIGAGIITRENLQIFLEKKGNVQEKMERAEIFHVTVPSQPLKKIIADGNYSYANDYITSENFSLDESQIGDFELILVHLNRKATTDEVLAELKERNLEPAKIGHLLAFGADYPEIQREFPIAALGSSWVDPDGFRGVPYLEGNDAERGLSLGWRGHHWDDGWRFLALRKSALGSLDS
ncbi:hypothetical protein ACFL2B_02160 [Patescibacteria group bacterium]